MSGLRIWIARARAQRFGWRSLVWVCCGALAAGGWTVRASENVPHRPFAQWADLPAPGEFVAGFVYEESEAYHIWANGRMQDVSWQAKGESYGIDVTQGYLALQYGINDRWAADLNLGVTTCGWRYFDNGVIKSTTGLMDPAFGIRYSIFKEDAAVSPWLPTLTFRAGAVLPGTYRQNFQFAPGVRSAGIEPELLARKHLGWPGLGVYADALYRWNRTTGNDQYMTTAGIFQQIKGWELAVGYRHMQTLSGGNIEFDAQNPAAMVYPRTVREINESIEAGFSYTTAKRRIRYGFHSRATIGGNNTDRKFWVGGSIEIPFGARAATRQSSGEMSS